MLRLLAVASAVSLAASPAAAQVAAPAAKPVTEKKICRSSTPTGSIMPGKRVCHTVTEWSQIDAGSNVNTDHFRDQATNPGLPSLSGSTGG